MDLTEGILGDPIKHWYYAHKARFINYLIHDELGVSNRLIDVGAGSAIFSLALLHTNPLLSVIAVDVNYKFQKIVDLDGRITFLRDGQGVSGDIYLFTDVLEHVSNDVETLSGYVNSASKGSKFVITVPAFMSLWSGHDVYLKHFRRYRKPEINHVIDLAGLKVVRSQYLFIPLFPLVWAIRKMPKRKQVGSQLKDHGRVVNKLILWLLNLDYLLSNYLPFGNSIIVLAEKR